MSEINKRSITLLKFTLRVIGCICLIIEAPVSAGVVFLLAEIVALN